MMAPTIIKKKTHHHQRLTLGRLYRAKYQMTFWLRICTPGMKPQVTKSFHQGDIFMYLGRSRESRPAPPEGRYSFSREDRYLLFLTPNGDVVSVLRGYVTGIVGDGVDDLPGRFWRDFEEQEEQEKTL